MLRLEWTQEDEQIRVIRDEWRNELMQQSASSSESESDPEEESKGFVKESGG